MPNSEEIRIVVVDDSVVARSFLRKTFDAAPDMWVVGAASDGRKAVAMVEHLVPDLVVMDIEMPVMDGLTALEIIRGERPQLPAIVFTSTQEKDAPLGMRVLALPQTKWLTKRNGDHSSSMVIEASEELILAVRQLTGRFPEPATVASGPRPALPNKQVRARREKRGPFEILAIGSSTGGPDALVKVLSKLPSDLSVPVVIVQHMPRQFTQKLAERLDYHSKLKVSHGAWGDRLVPGHVYVAPGGFQMALERDGTQIKIITNKDPVEHGCRPAVDPLFRSVAKVYSSRVLAVVLTGMGRDGAVGCQAIHEAGGRILIQDEETSVVWGMPGEVHRAGLDDEVYPIGEMAAAITHTLSVAARRHARRTG